MTFDDVQEVFRPLAHPLDEATAVGMTRTLALGDLCVVAHDWLDGTEISVHRDGDDETYITAEEWPVFQEMVRKQMEWAGKQR
jgi:hypothetical protein